MYTYQVVKRQNKTKAKTKTHTHSHTQKKIEPGIYALNPSNTKVQP